MGEGISGQIRSWLDISSLNVDVMRISRFCLLLLSLLEIYYFVVLVVVSSCVSFDPLNCVESDRILSSGIDMDAGQKYRYKTLSELQPQAFEPQGP